MPTTHEICGVTIHWLEPSELSFETTLGLAEPCNGHSFAVFHEPGQIFKPLEEYPGPITRVDKRELLKAMWHGFGYDGPTNDLATAFHVDQNYSAADPPVELLVPTTVYTFDLPDSDQSWIASLVGDEGLQSFVQRDLLMLQNIGFYLWSKGLVSDDLRYNGRWGAHVSFHAMWIIQVGYGEDPDVDWWLEGWVDPAKVQATKVPVTAKPERRPVQMHRTFAL